ncbi:prealbumin-like fold domain-containing protein [Bifidobacterium parmae]|uniref:Cna protein B-type domain-containing protein n=1 Tax=Bifidobacterium parmae TaxID=361854 RepID=A0A2N5J5H6_9BIFI|nr:prealbumin-like fold domain-containing protein [Bifidobacterium parmae]PLS29443.1 Cna protein B-type domain-containing protein [Bifidobacterium parmae]
MTGMNGRRMARLAAATIATIAMLVAGASPAVAQDTAVGTVGAATSDSSSSTSTGTDAGTSGGAGADTAGTADGNGGADGGTNDGAATNDAQSGAASGSTDATQSDGQTAAPAPTAVGCDDVQDWDTLAGCFAQSGDVVITKDIPVPATGAIDVGTDTAAVTVTLTAVNGAKLTGKNADGTANGGTGAFLVVHSGSNLTIGENGKDTSFTYSDGSRNLVYVASTATLTINGGKFTGNDISTSADKDGAIAYSAGDVTINGGEFTGNKARNGGVVYNDGGTLTINGGTFGVKLDDGTFVGNETTSDGGVIYDKQQGVTADEQRVTTTINGGTFTGNKAPGGGVMVSEGGTTTITGGTFDSNEATWTKNIKSGGGVIRLITPSGNREIGGKLEISGGEFTNNTVAAKNQAHSGGGVVWAQGDVTIDGGVFADNYVEGMTSGWSGGGAIYIYSGNAGHPNPWSTGDGSGFHSTLIVSRGTFLDNATHGDGGAIFVGWWSTAIFTGISGRNAPAYGNVTPNTPVWFQGNQAEHLGGAVYTEERTTTFMGKSVAYNNHAGHFGGGLWLCPSGVGFNSKGGNMLLFDNGVDATYDVDVVKDATKRTQIAQKTEYGQSGEDFAIMAPVKNGITTNSFELSDENWAGESGAITWSADGQQPSRSSTGYDRNGTDLSTVPLTHDTAKDNAKYSSLDADGKRQWTGTTNINQTQVDGHGKTAGVGLTSSVSDDLKAEAKANALVTFTGNAVSLSGGAFGTDGNVMFSTPYTMSWSKAKASGTADNATVKTDADRLGGSKWKLSTTDGGPLEANMRPADCVTDATARVVSDSCWHNLADKTGDKWVIIEDNGTRDNDRTPGDISINNLKAGTYTLQETGAPSNYQQTTTTYTFTVTQPAAGSKYEEPALIVANKPDGTSSSDGKGPLDTTGKVIGNLPETKSVSWDKIDANDDTKLLPGSTWKITDENGNAIAGFGNIADNTGDASYSGEDENPTAGRFTVKGLTVDKTYKLCETGVPVGYQQPTDTCRAFTIDGSGVVTWADKSEGRITNKPTQVTWTKIGADDQALLPGTVWTVETCDTTNGGTTCANIVKDSAHTVVDCATGSCTTPSDGKQYYEDVDSRGSGYITIRNLPYGTYKLTEATAPDGYAKPDATTYALITVPETGDATMSLHGLWARMNVAGSSADCVAVASTTGSGPTPCRLVNVKTVAALPLTGGLDARDWLLIGGIAAVAAALALALVNEYRKRKGLA